MAFPTTSGAWHLNSGQSLANRGSPRRMIFRGVGDFPKREGPNHASGAARPTGAFIGAHERRRLLVERVRLAGDLEDDVHSAEPIPAMAGAL